MMSARRLLVLLAVAASLGVVAVGQDPPAPVPPYGDASMYGCSTAEYPEGSPYEKNLNDLVSSLSAAAAANGNGWFRNGSAGAAPDQVWGLIMCYADSNLTQCTECLRSAPAVGGPRGLCARSREVLAVYGDGGVRRGGCVLRYAGEPFLGNATTGVWEASWSPTDAAGGLNATKRRLLSGLAEAAAEAPARFASGSLAYTDVRGGEAQVVYGLAQCTRDLLPSQCQACLADQLQEGVEGNNSTGGSVMGFSCYTRFQLNQPIALIPGLLTPLAAPPPAASPPAPY